MMCERLVVRVMFGRRWIETGDPENLTFGDLDYARTFMLPVELGRRVCKVFYDEEHWDA